MIDYGIYEIKQDEATKEIIVYEQLECKERRFYSIENVVNYINNELRKTEMGI